MSKKSHYSGANTIVYDTEWRRRLARNRRKTKEAQKRRADNRARFEADLLAYELRRSVLIKKTSDDENGSGGETTQ
jgi:hypothetical protein